MHLVKVGIGVFAYAAEHEDSVMDLEVAGVFSRFGFFGMKEVIGEVGREIFAEVSFLVRDVDALGELGSFGVGLFDFETVSLKSAFLDEEFLLK